MGISLEIRLLRWRKIEIRGEEDNRKKTSNHPLFEESNGYKIVRKKGFRGKKNCFKHPQPKIPGKL